jgi:hypothetical protein
MASWSNKIKQSMNTIVAESGVTFDAGFFGQNVIVLSFEVADNLTEAKWYNVNQWNLRLPGLL